MQTQLPQDLLATEKGKQANTILRNCVHCGFCLSACPTYGLLGDELDSPRGRIYLIKRALEGHAVSQSTLAHLDRCLTCRSCETTCPSGVAYGHLLDIGREVVERKVPRPLSQRLMREGLRRFLTTPWLINLAATFAPWVKHSSAKKALKQKQKTAPDSINQGKVLLISGCVQPTLAPNINLASQVVLQQLGYQVQLTPQFECCGAVSHHLSAAEATQKQVIHNVKTWGALLEQGVKAIISNASGCGVMIKDYAHFLKTEGELELIPLAEKVVQHTYDIGEFLMKQPVLHLEKFTFTGTTPIAFQAPCTLQHGQKLQGKVEAFLTQLGYRLVPVPDAHLCCGSAGTYSIFQKSLSSQLKENKLKALHSADPRLIVTANIGCLMHLQSGTDTPIVHWIELLAGSAPLSNTAQGDANV